MLNPIHEFSLLAVHGIVKIQLLWSHVYLIVDLQYLREEGSLTVDFKWFNFDCYVSCFSIISSPKGWGQVDIIAKSIMAALMNILPTQCYIVLRIDMHINCSILVEGDEIIGHSSWVHLAVHALDILVLPIKAYWTSACAFIDLNCASPLRHEGQICRTSQMHHGIFREVVEVAKIHEVSR